MRQIRQIADRRNLQNRGICQICPPHSRCVNRVFCGALCRKNTSVCEKARSTTRHLRWGAMDLRGPISRCVHAQPKLGEMHTRDGRVPQSLAAPRSRVQVEGAPQRRRRSRAQRSASPLPPPFAIAQRNRSGGLARELSARRTRARTRECGATRDAPLTGAPGSASSALAPSPRSSLASSHNQMSRGAWDALALARPHTTECRGARSPLAQPNVAGAKARGPAAAALSLASARLAETNVVGPRERLGLRGCGKGPASLTVGGPRRKKCVAPASRPPL